MRRSSVGSGSFVQIEYRFFRLNAAGIVDSAERLRLPNDEAAIEHARALRDEARIEIWAGSRKVGVTPPARRSMSA